MSEWVWGKYGKMFVVHFRGETVCTCESAVQAAKIALEHNAFADLVAACEAAMDWVQRYSAVPRSADIAMTLCAALAKAKGESTDEGN